MRSEPSAAESPVLSEVRLANGIAPLSMLQSQNWQLVIEKCNLQNGNDRTSGPLAPVGEKVRVRGNASLQMLLLLRVFPLPPPIRPSATFSPTGEKVATPLSVCAVCVDFTNSCGFSCYPKSGESTRYNDCREFATLRKPLFCKWL